MSEQSIPSRDDGDNQNVEPEAKQFGKVAKTAMNLGYSHGAIHCLLVLDTYWRDKDRVTGRPKDDAYPGQQRLARELGVTRGTVQSYLNELAGLSVRGKPPKPAVIRKVRRGQGKTNVYVRLPQLRRHLRAVPPDGQPDAQPVEHQEDQPVEHLDDQPVAHKADEVEADEVEADKSKSTAVIGVVRTTPDDSDEPPDDPPETPDTEERASVVQYMEDTLLPVLKDLHDEKELPWDEGTGITLARLILSTPALHEGHISYMADKLTDNMPDKRYGIYDVDKIEDPARYVYAALRSRRYHRQLPAHYDAYQGFGFA